MNDAISKRTFDNVSVLIPVYQPCDKLVILIEELKKYKFREIILVNDGSSKKYENLLNKLKNEGCSLISYDINRGKGFALKKGIIYFLGKNKKGSTLVTADADGQHNPGDIAKIASIVNNKRNTIVLGTRRLTRKDPKRSRFGNFITRRVFSLISGMKIYDTQTGLRGFPYEALPKLLNLPGDRYEYEMNVLMTFNEMNFNIWEEYIKVIYEDNNRGSHFHTIRDSYLIYKNMLATLKVDFVTIIWHYAVFILMAYLVPKSILAIVGTAHLIRSVMLFWLDWRSYESPLNVPKKRFKALKGLGNTALIILYEFIVIKLLMLAGLPLINAKVLSDLTLFFVSFFSRRRLYLPMQPRRIVKHREEN